MDEKVLLQQIAQMMDEKLAVQTQAMTQMMDKRFAEQDARIDKRFAEQDARIEQMFHDQTESMSTLMDAKLVAVKDEIKEEVKREIGVVIEQKVVRRLDNLFDAYMAGQERQRLMQDQIDTLTARLDKLELVVKSIAS